MAVALAMEAADSSPLVQMRLLGFWKLMVIVILMIIVMSKGKDNERRESSVSECSVDLEIGPLETKACLARTMGDCRICYLSLDITNNQDSGIPIELGCSCKDDLAVAHKQCAEAWFKIKGNNSGKEKPISMADQFPNPDLENPFEDNDNHADVCDFADDGILGYIGQMLMEEDMDGQMPMLQESLEFQAKERSFYEVLGQKYPPSPPPQQQDLNNNNSEIDVLHDFDAFIRKGFDDANKFLPGGSKVLDEAQSRGKKNRKDDERGEDERSMKLAAVYPEFDDVPKEEFDGVLLTESGENKKKFEAYRADLLEAGSKSGSRRKSGPVKKNQNKKKEMIDLRFLLISCAQLVAAGDRVAACEALKKIRLHSSPYGNGEQRLAHYFADGLEARLAGNGSEIHKSLLKIRTATSDWLRALYTCHAAAPFNKVSYYISNKLIALKSEKAMRIHVIDFGILYGFCWPSFIQRLAEREGGPPKLRITGIDFPQPGFRPSEKVEEAGRRLSRYAEMFNVPFEYNAIAQNWETIRVEDLKIEEGEFVAVNCLYRAQHLMDDGNLENCSRTRVLNLIRKTNPDIFIHGIINLTYGMPFFVSRFREALFHYSAHYDYLEATIPREKPERVHIEREMLGSELFNVIACEGWERVERPETYKQWQVRHLEAGFMQVSFEKQLIDSTMSVSKKVYHREFVVDEVKQWLLMGWKGRIMYALSCWQPILSN
ncbi:hypothetical protein CASFOL_006628 [Castilleja foliolosa]|uniref:RING-CH-type domain-containing protein n=1 Tax=Castilleja foliolosa TaxID=1961234 RepID=A0ABD3E6X7_9LAMI